jgi:hypothetical protein
MRVKSSIVLTVSNRFAAVENYDAEVDVNRAWETFRICTVLFKETLGYYELKHKPWFDDPTLSR